MPETSRAGESIRTGGPGIARLFPIVAFLSVLGGSFKVVSGLVFGSKAALVDALTSIANVLAVLAVTKYERLSLRPPDEDHHYGHGRMSVGGSMFAVALYSMVGGAMLVDLVYSSIASYEVHILATVFAALGAIPYAAAIALSRRMGGSYGTYAKFTAVELMESAVVVLSSLGGAVVNYLVDSAGAAALLTYLYVGIVREVRSLLHVVSDKAPGFLAESIRRAARELNVEIRSIRIREVATGKYYGDLTIALPAEIPLGRAHEIAHAVERSLKSMGVDIDLTVHVEPA